MVQEIMQNKFFVGTGLSGFTDKYVDLAAAATAMNSKQFHQVTKGGEALSYNVTVRQVSGTKASLVHTAVNNWRVRNAVKQFSKGWKAQLRHATVKSKDLATYGQRVRLSLDSDGYAAGSTGGHSYSKLANNLIPSQSYSGGAGLGEWFADYTDIAGNTVTYVDANNLTEVAVTDAAGAVTERTAILTGASAAGHFGVVAEYQAGRRDPQTYEEDTPGPDDDSLMRTLFSTSEELSDDILEAVDDFGDWRPYSTATYDNIIQITTLAAPGASVTYPDASTNCDVPLGLLKLTASEVGTVWEVTIHAVYEM